MHNPHDPHDPQQPVSIEESKRLGYEISDVAIPILLKWGAVLAVFVGVASFVTLLMYFYFVNRAAEEVTAYPLRTTREMPPPSTPLIQALPVRDIKDFRRKEEEDLTTYGYTKEGKIHIPVEEALKIVAKRGLPSVTSEMPRPGAPHPPNTPGRTGSAPTTGTAPTPPANNGVNVPTQSPAPIQLPGGGQIIYRDGNKNGPSSGPGGSGAKP
jgi:hypothetical protein